MWDAHGRPTHCFSDNESLCFANQNPAVNLPKIANPFWKPTFGLNQYMLKETAARTSPVSTPLANRI